LIQCGHESALALEVGQALEGAGRRALPIVLENRRQAQAGPLLASLEQVQCAWVFSDDLFSTFMSVFATDLAFAMRARARRGMPVVGVGGGALALGGLLLASRVCQTSRFELVGGLGWAPRLIVDGGANRGPGDAVVVRGSVRALPGLLGVDLGERGGIRVDGGRIESIGKQSIVLMGGNERGELHTMRIDPGQAATIAPPPYAPFDRGIVPPATLRSIAREAPSHPPMLRQAPPPDEVPPRLVMSRVCPMCGKVHPAERRRAAAQR
jgi:hypothetical protein